MASILAVSCWEILHELSTYLTRCRPARHAERKAIPLSPADLHADGRAPTCRAGRTVLGTSHASHNLPQSTMRHVSQGSRASQGSGDRARSDRIFADAAIAC